MTSEASSGSASSLLGVLECPLRKGYIEFEYQPGDTVLELKQKAAEAWGPPVAMGGEDYGQRRILWDLGVWAILCETRSGTYVALSDRDKIPASPPDTSTWVEDLKTTPDVSRYWDLPAGLIHASDMATRVRARHLFDEGGRFSGADTEGSDVTEVDEPQLDLDLGLARDYRVPRHKRYSVRLIALVVITGG